MYLLKGKVVLVTGGSSGIGCALGHEIVKRGGMVALCARNIEKLKEKFIDVDEEQKLLAQVDVTDEAACKSFVEAVEERWGRIDVLINNAGISMRGLFEDTQVSVLRELMEVNFFGAVNCTKHAQKTIIKNKGIIVGVSSIAGYKGLPARTGYCASKFALQGFLESLRTEMLPLGVHVMWVSPGFTASNIRNVARSSDGSIQGETPLDEKSLMSAEECANIILDAIERKKRTIIMTLIGKMTVFVNKFLPGFVDKRVYKHFLNEPNSPIKRYETND